MSTTSSVQNGLYLMANQVHLALSHLPDLNHLHRTWFEERLEQELCPLHNLLVMASTAGEWPYMPVIILSGAGEFAHATQHSMLAYLEVIAADDPDIKANPWYLEPPEGAMAEVGEDDMKDIWWQAEAVSGAKRTRERVVEDEAEEGQRRKKEPGGVEEDVEMEEMGPDERVQHHKEK
ncbi:hypothetical protein AcV5_007945 [Taiwanofungus camphoratus]|nr:hypothetical protein AcV5_007945 [Antrodia cinnamomea]